MSFMDIMNSMNVSSSKFTISLLITLVALVSWWYLLIWNSRSRCYAAVPTFIAIHNSTTTTEIIFKGNALGVNGTGQY